MSYWDDTVEDRSRHYAQELRELKEKEKLFDECGFVPTEENLKQEIERIRRKISPQEDNSSFGGW